MEYAFSKSLHRPMTPNNQPGFRGKYFRFSLLSLNYANGLPVYEDTVELCL